MPRLIEVTRARARLAPWLRPTALERAPGLGEQVWLKLENGNRTRSFKARGALNAMLQLDAAARGTEATVAGLVFGINGAVGFASTLLVAYIIDNWGGYGSMYIYVGILTAAAGIIVLLTPFPNYRTQGN